MDSIALTPAQLDKLLHSPAPTRDYSAKLVDRMSVLRFPDADPLKLSAFGARDAVEHLYQVASELERKAKLQTWAGGQTQPQIKPRDPRARRG
jgi:hypothetical protein